jgi:excinuclease ABC subunit B
MAEELTEYYAELGVRIRYLHSDVQTLERMEIIRELREGAFDALVGINLLREGLDIPEVALVAILDADKEGFLRSERSLIQTIGRAARNARGRVLLYADQDTESIRRTLAETERRRGVQEAYNREHGITPKTIEKKIASLRESVWEQDYVTVPTKDERERGLGVPPHELPALIESLRGEMRAASRAREFERAAELRDRIRELEVERLRST